MRVTQFLCCLLGSVSLVYGQPLTRLAASNEPPDTDHTGEIISFSDVGSGAGTDPPRPWFCYTTQTGSVLWLFPNGSALQFESRSLAVQDEVFIRDFPNFGVALFRGPTHFSPDGEHCCVRTNTALRRCVTFTPCPTLSPLSNGMISYDATTNMATYTCDPGYTISGATPITCMSDGTSAGTWSPTPAVTCTSVPDQIDHSRIVTTSISLASMTVSFPTPNDNNSPITAYVYMLCQGTCTNSPTPTTITDYSVSGGDTVFTIGGLIPNSVYTLRVAAINEAGNGPTPTDDADAHTFDSSTSADGTPINLALSTTAVSETSLLVSWIYPPLGFAADVVTESFTVTWTRVSDFTPSGSSIVQSLAYQITGLIPGGSYVIDVVAIYSSPMLTSDPATIIGEPTPGPIALLNPDDHIVPLISAIALGTPGVSPTSMRIQWIAPDVPFVRRYIGSIEVTPFTSSSTRRRRQTETITVNTTDTFLTVNDFPGAGTNTPNIAAEIGPPGSEPILLNVFPVGTTFTAPETTPNAPTDFTIVVNPLDPYRALDLSWNLPTQPNGVLRRCTITETSPARGSIPLVLGNPVVTTHTLSNRDPGTDYTFELTCANMFTSPAVTMSGRTTSVGAVEPIADQSVPTGNNATFICVAVGAPSNVMYTWSYDLSGTSVPIRNSETADRAVGINTNMLTIMNVGVQDEEGYRCTVSVDGVMLGFSAAVLSVVTPFFNQTLLPEYLLTAGDNLTLTCIGENPVGAESPLFIRWRFDDTFLIKSDPRITNMMIGSNQLLSQLLIPNIQPSYRGVFGCYLSNRLPFESRNAVFNLTNAVVLLICPDLTIPANGALVYSDTTIPRAEGSTATYTCTTGYQVTGLMMRTCTVSGWSTGDDPVCTVLRCPGGTYQEELSTGESACVSCPGNSVSIVENSVECTCFRGYYRTALEGPNIPCSTPPNNCKSLQAVAERTRGNTITVRWERPEITGRDDLYYNIFYSVDNQTFTQHNRRPYVKHDSLVDYSVSGLQPLTTYTIRVIPENGVSVQEEGGQSRSCEVVARTGDTRSNAPSLVIGFCTVVVWTTPTRSYGRITGYDIRFIPQGSGSDLMVSKGRRELFHAVGDTGLVTTDNVMVQVRAKTSAAEGRWSELVPLGCRNANGFTGPL